VHSTGLTDSCGSWQVKKLERSGALKAAQEQVYADAELRERLQSCHRSVPALRTALMSQVGVLASQRAM
jgi:hypothetical protein